jgi:glycosyltransferase involved in cell wall biosynthesis
MRIKKTEKINLHIYPSNIKHESRILKETETIARFCFVDKIFIIGIKEKGLRERETLDGKREIRRIPLGLKVLPSHSFFKLLKYFEWLSRVLINFKSRNIFLVNCHSLSVLLLGALFKLFRKSKLVYDTHELETEGAGVSGGRKMLSKIVEAILINYIDRLIVVSDSIADWYKNRYHLNKVYVVKNFPSRQKITNGNILKEKFDIKNNEILYMNHGALGEGRGIDILLDVFSQIDKRKHIIFMGYGRAEKRIREYEKKFPNIHFQPAVEPEDVINYIGGADVGISLIENTCLSYFYSLPNKLFECLLSGLPVIVSDFPEMGKVIDENNCGWKVTVDEKSVRRLVEKISKEDIEEKKKATFKCRDKFVWENESKKLLKVYEDLFKE